MKLKEIIAKLEKKFPCKHAEDWDNVGLLVGDRNSEIKRIQFSIDATDEAINRAIDKDVDLIITHHPFIFKPLKHIIENDILGRKIRKLIKNDINVYSIHTNLDSSRQGLNDYVLKKLEVKQYKILDYDEENDCGIGRIFTLDEEITLFDYVKFLKTKLGINELKIVSKNLDKKIKKVALVNGSAMSYWKKAKQENVDLFITGDITYHNALDSREVGLDLIDFGHYESESFFYEILQEELADGNLEFYTFNDGPIFKTL